MTEEQKDRFNELLNTIVNAAEDLGMEKMKYGNKTNIRLAEEYLEEVMNNLTTFMEGLNG